MRSPSHHLLRTLAAVPVSSHILELGCGTGRHTEPLLRLGFPVHACDARAAAVEETRTRIEALVGAATAERCVQAVAPDGFEAYPEDAFDWIVAFEPTAYAASDEELAGVLATTRRLLKPGGWIYVALAAEGTPTRNGTVETMTPERLAATAATANFAHAVAPERAEEHGTALVRGIFRRVEEGTPR